MVPISLESAQKVGRERGLDFAQGEAVSLTHSNSPIAILTGGPGTGKTTVLGTVVPNSKSSKEKSNANGPDGESSQPIGQIDRRRRLAQYTGLWETRTDRPAILGL